MWAELVYELFNARNDYAYTDLWNKARKRQLSKSEYVNACLGLEYKAAKGQSDFFKKVWLPNARKLGASHWYSTIEPFQEFCRKDLHNAQQIQYYGDGYDRAIRR